MKLKAGVAKLQGVCLRLGRSRCIGLGFREPTKPHINERCYGLWRCDAFIRSGKHINAAT